MLYVIVSSELRQKNLSYVTARNWNATYVQALVPKHGAQYENPIQVGLNRQLRGVLDVRAKPLTTFATCGPVSNKCRLGSCWIVIITFRYMMKCILLERNIWHGKCQQQKNSLKLCVKESADISHHSASWWWPYSMGQPRGSRTGIKI